jgi:hypothetical protein
MGGRYKNSYNSMGATCAAHQFHFVDYSNNMLWEMYNYDAHNRVIFTYQICFRKPSLKLVAAPVYIWHGTRGCCDPPVEEHCCTMYENRLSCVVDCLPFVWDDTYIHIDVIVLFCYMEQIIVKCYDSILTDVSSDLLQCRNPHYVGTLFLLRAASL